MLDLLPHLGTWRPAASGQRCAVATVVGAAGSVPRPVGTSMLVSETGEVLDTITVQALINRYPTVCGMTGTALAAGEQLRQFYKLGVSPIPPNTPNVREDETDRGTGCRS